MTTPARNLVWICLLALAAVAGPASPALLAAEADSMLTLKARSRTEVKGKKGQFQIQNKAIRWEASKTAIVVCDMWDQHWCRGATSRVGEMAPRMNQVIHAARDKGVLIIHCPSSCMEAYKGTPMRLLAQNAPLVKTTIPLARWCHLDDKTEAALPIDDRDGGCDCWPTCASGGPWRRQIAAIDIKQGDAITDSGEAYYLMKQKGIKNVIVMGVHTNMCVLGRPFSIRQMVYQGQNVVLMRDMTDTMYNSRSAPYVPHTKGTDLVIEHIEKFWCPTIASSDFAGKKEFRFAEADKPHVVFMIGEREYKTDETLPVFAKAELESRGLRCTIVHADEKDKNNFPGLKALKTADLLVLSVRRRSLPKAQLALVREHLAAGKPLVGIRTACHPFHTHGKHPEGHEEWQGFDPEVLGGNYTGHHGNGPKTIITLAEGNEKHPILKGVNMSSFRGGGSLYEVSPLAKTTKPLLIGKVPEHPAEPIAWTNSYKGGRIFYTSLGHIEDFKSDQFNRLLTNAVFWGLDKPVPSKERQSQVSLKK